MRLTSGGVAAIAAYLSAWAVSLLAKNNTSPRREIARTTARPITSRTL